MNAPSLAAWPLADADGFTTFHGTPIVAIGEDCGTLLMLGHPDDRTILAATSAQYRVLYGQRIRSGRELGDLLQGEGSPRRQLPLAHRGDRPGRGRPRVRPSQGPARRRDEDLTAPTRSASSSSGTRLLRLRAGRHTAPDLGAGHRTQCRPDHRHATPRRPGDRCWPPSLRWKEAT